MLDPSTVQCPYCWQSIDVFIDASISHQTYIEDCSVCCRPLVIHVEIDPQAGCIVHVTTEDQA